MQQTFVVDVVDVVDEDDQLMLEVQQGSAWAFEQIVKKWQSAVFGYLYNRTRDREVSEELAQETLFRVYRKASLYDARGTFRGWVFTIAAHLLIDMGRKKSRESKSRKDSIVRNSEGYVEHLADLLPDRSIAAEDKAYGCEVLEEVQVILEQMVPEQAEAWRLYNLGEMTIPEIAERTSTCVPTVKGRLRLAREEMRYLMECRGFVV